MNTIIQRKSFILSTLFLLISLGLLFFLLNGIRINEKEYITVQEKWQAENDRRDSVQKTANFLEKVGSERVLLDSKFVESKDIVPFLDTLEEIARETNIKIEVLSVTEEKEPSLLATVKTSGSFSNTYKFITLLENAEYSLAFTSVDLKSSGETSQVKVPRMPEWTATIQVKLLSFIK